MTRESLDQVRDLGFHVMVTANSKGLLWTQHGAGLAATLGSEVVAVDRMDDDEVRRGKKCALNRRRDGLCSSGRCRACITHRIILHYIRATSLHGLESVEACSIRSRDWEGGGRASAERG